MIMKFQYQKHLEELSQYKVGDIIERGEPKGSRHELIALLVRAGYVTACRDRKVVVVREIPARFQYYSVYKQRLCKNEQNKTALNFWLNNYEPKYSTCIPIFYAVYLYIHKHDHVFTQKDVYEYFSGGIAKKSIRSYIYLFMNKGVLKGDGNCNYIKTRDIPSCINSCVTLKRAKRLSKQPPIHPKIYKKSHAKLYEMAAKAGLYN